MVLETDAATQVKQALYSDDFDVSVVGGPIAELKFRMLVNFNCFCCVSVCRMQLPLVGMSVLKGLGKS